MTKTIEHFKIEESQSEIRTRVLEIRALGEDKLTDALRTERDALDKKYAAGEIKFRASIKAMKAEQESGLTLVDSEARELQLLTNRASAGGGLGAIAAAVLSGHACEGEARELQQAHSLKGNQIPIELMRSPMVEDRTAGITPGPTDAPADQRPIIPAIFPSSVASFLGISGESIGTGEQAFAVVSTSASPGAPAEGDEQAHSTAAFESRCTCSELGLQASLFFSLEDAHARIQGLSDALRMNLSDALSDELDDQILTGSNGLFTGANLADHDATGVGTFVTMKKRVVYDAIDGKYANNAGDLRLVMGSASLAFMGGVYRGNNSDVDTLESITGKVAGIRVSSHVPSVSGSKQELVAARGMAQHVAVALWGIDLVEDPYSDEPRAGETILTGRMLHAIKILRKDGFRKVELQHA